MINNVREFAPFAKFAKVIGRENFATYGIYIYVYVELSSVALYLDSPVDLLYLCVYSGSHVGGGEHGVCHFVCQRYIEGSI